MLLFLMDPSAQDDIITAVGPNLQVVGAKEINAEGMLVTPGWIDVHTHYDARELLCDSMLTQPFFTVHSSEATWDPLLSPSAHCGVTTGRQIVSLF